MQADESFHNLHQKIQVEFDLDDDHMYGFAVGKKFWGGEIITEGNPFEASINLKISEITYGQLIYMYDYGDEISFNVELIDVE